MSKPENQAMQSLKVALDNALARLNHLEGQDRIAFANEYKEWLGEDLDSDVLALREIKYKL